MSYIIGAALGIGTFVKKNGKLFLALLLVYLFVIFGFNTFNPDMQTYMTQYYNPGYTVAAEPLYLLVSDVFLYFKVDYMVMRAVLGAIGLILITITFIDFSPYPAAVLFLYAIYPFCMDVVQVRSFIAVAITFFSIRFLLYYKLDKKKINIVAFIVCILLATGFHYSSILFLILLLTLFDFQKHFVFYYFVLPLTMIYFVMNLSDFLPFIERIIGHRKAMIWVGGEKSASLIRIVRLVVSRFGFVLIAYMFGRVKKTKVRIVTEEKANKKESIYNNEMIDKCLMLGSFYVFLYTVLDINIAGDYERLSRLAVMMITLLLSRYIYRVDAVNKLYMWVVTYIYHILYFFSIMYGMKASYQYYFDCVFRCIMENNSFFTNS